MQNNPWQFEGKDFLTEDAQEKLDSGFIGFVYIIHDTLTEKKYLGKKMLLKKTKLPPLKGKLKKRIKIGQSDWEKYYGSSELVQGLVLERSQDFHREILFFAKSKGELNYIEAAEQFRRNVLLDDSWMNGIINCRINRSHVRGLRELQ